MRQECFKQLRETAEILTAEYGELNTKTKEVLADNAMMVKEFEAISNAWDQGQDKETMERALWTCIRTAEKAIATHGKRGQLFNEVHDRLQEVANYLLENSKKDTEKIQELCGQVEDLQTMVRHLNYKEQEMKRSIKMATTDPDKKVYDILLELETIMEKEYKLPGGERI